MTRRPALDALAARAGVEARYRDVTGAEHRAGETTLVALLDAMGYDGSDETRAADSLAELERLEASALLDPVAVISQERLAQYRLPVRMPPGVNPGEWHVVVECEDHGRLEHQGNDSPPALPAGLPPGYHRARVTVRDAGEERQGEQDIIIAPGRCTVPEDSLGSRRVFGLLVNLYSVRSAANWGIGDLSDLSKLAAWVRTHGGAFVGVNPLHALWNRDGDISPYSPLTRLYRNSLYLDVTAVPELADCEPARSLMRSDAFARDLGAARAGSRIPYEAVRELKGRVLQLLHHTFRERHGSGATARGQAFRRYLETEGARLQQFATFVVLAEHLRDRGVRGDSPLGWPTQYRDASATAIMTFAREHALAIERECYVQFELDRQLEAAAATGLPLGIYQDLAVGSARNGWDVWMWPRLFARNATVGAPPDRYAPGGQDWGLPPLNPHRLRAERYRYWIALLRAALAHTGILRVDHVMGLFRLFWIPAGRGAAEGAYVRYPADDLLGILALESRRHQAIIVGEDLGTVPPEVPAAMARRGILGSRVLYFARDRQGAFLPPRNYDPEALVSVGTHDHVPLAGYWTGRDLEIRREVGMSSAAESESANRAAERSHLTDRLATEGFLPQSRPPQGYKELVRAVHGFLSRTPCPLLGVALDDVAAETEPVNVPAVGPDRYPSWTRRMRLTIEELATDPTAAAALQPLGERRYPAAAEGS